MFNKNNILKNNIHSTNLSTPHILYDNIILNFPFNVFTIGGDYHIKAKATEMMDWFIERIESSQYISFEYNKFLVWNSNVVIFAKAVNDYIFDVMIDQNFFEGDFLISGEREFVSNLMKEFEEVWKTKILKPNEKVNVISRNSSGGLSSTTLPIKKYDKFYPEIYPHIPDPIDFIDKYLSSSSNILIFLGEPGTGKSALIGEIIKRSNSKVSVVYDPEVMKNDSLYTDFISNEDRGILILEDADIILEDRIISQNEVMSRLLNIADGIIDTSNFKIIITANIKNKHNIDSALIRPGRCFDIIEFKDLSYEDALRAAKAIGVNLIEDKDNFTVAEIFNSKSQISTKRKVGF